MHSVLIVDDEAPAREFIADLVALYLPDSVITKIDNPQTALHCLREDDFDILFLDIFMTGMTGLELLKKLNLKEKYPYTVLVSAYREFDYAIKGIELGVMQYLTKPLHRKKVYETIRLYLKRMSTSTIEIVLPHTNRRLKIEQILAIQTADRSKVTIHTSDSIVRYVTGTLSKLQSLLPSHFRYIRRNCLLNYHAITDYNLKTREVVVVCNNENVTFNVSRDYLKELATWLKQIYNSDTMENGELTIDNF